MYSPFSSAEQCSTENSNWKPSHARLNGRALFCRFKPIYLVPSAPIITIYRYNHDLITVTEQHCVVHVTVLFLKLVTPIRAEQRRFKLELRINQLTKRNISRWVSDGSHSNQPDAESSFEPHTFCKKNQHHYCLTFYVQYKPAINQLKFHLPSGAIGPGFSKSCTISQDQENATQWLTVYLRV